MKIITFYVFVGLFIGFLFVYIFKPKPIVIVSESNKYEPNLNNAGKVTYLDDNGVCYKYDKIKIKC